MNAWDLYIPFKPNRKRNGQFTVGNTPYTKGKPWSEWMSEDGAKRALKGLKRTGDPNFGGFIKRPVAGVSIDTHKVCFFESMKDAARKTNICYHSIVKVCRKERHKAGGCMWFFVDDAELKQYL